MPRIFKGIESELRLLLHPCILTGEITDIKIALFTNDPSVAIEFTDRYTIDDNILTLTVPTWAFGTMEDGVINYVIQGMHNDDAFITDRQSNYYLKTPTDYIPEEMPKEVVLGELTTMIVENGVFEYTPTDVDAWNKATIEVNVPSAGDFNIDAVSTSLGVGNWTKWTRTAAQYGLDGITEITIDASQYQEWTKAYTLLKAYQNTEEAYITENGEYRANIGYDGFALKGNNVAWVIDVVPTIDTDVEMWVKPYDGAPNMWQGFIGSQVNDDDNTTFQIRKVDGSNTFSFRFGEQTFEYGFEYERWYRLRMNRNGVWVNGEQVCGWDVQAFEENPNPLMINGIYNLNFESENYRMNNASYGYVYFHNTDSLLVPFNNGLFIGNGVQTIGRPAADDATLHYENNWYPKGYTKVTVDVQNVSEERAEELREEGRNDIRNRLQSIEITENGRYSVDDEFQILSLWYRGGYHTDTISTYDINRIEVTFKAATSESINGQGQPFILGGSMWGLNESGEDNACARAIQYAYGRIVGYWEGKWTDAVSCMDGEWLTITLDENGMTVKYPTRERYCEYTHDNGNRNGGENIFPFIIGGLGRRKPLEDGNYSANIIEDTQFRGDIKEVKINTNSMGEITYIPNGWGVWERKVENTGEYLSALEPTEGEITLTVENGKKYGEGWREINVNVDGEESVAANARVLDITENGIYTSRYSNESEFIVGGTSQVTGIYDDGTEFYDTAVLYGSLIPLNIVPTVDSRIEFWYLPNMPHMGDGFHQIIQSTNGQIQIIFDGGGVDNKTLRFIFGDKSVSYTPSNIGDEWWHIILDKNGLIFNGEEFPFDATATFKKADTNVYVNGNILNSRKANGTFGMVKIDETTFIPKEGGYLNFTTNELCPFEQYNIGILDDSTPITKGAFLDYSVYDTGLKITEDSVIDMWFVRPPKKIDGYVFKSPLFNVRYDTNKYYIMTNGVEKNTYEYSMDRENVINITISKTDGFKKIGTYATQTISLTDTVLSSGNHTLLLDSKYNTYGLIKIDGNVIIPTENGFLNTTTNEYLKKVEEYGGEYVYKNPFYEYVNNTEKTPIEIDGNLIKTVNVNVVPKIKLADEKFSFRQAQFTKIPEWADIDGIEDMSNFFENCSKLTEIRWFDASRTTNMSSTFLYCSEFTHFPALNTIRVTKMDSMFNACNKMVSVPPLDARNVKKHTYGPIGSWTLSNLTDFGGLIGLRASMDGSYGFDKCPNLSYQSCINILNGLYDFVGNGETPASNEGKFKVHSNFLTTVGDEISIGVQKGWTITA